MDSRHVLYYYYTVKIHVNLSIFDTIFKFINLRRILKITSFIPSVAKLSQCYLHITLKYPFIYSVIQLILFGVLNYRQRTELRQVTVCAIFLVYKVNKTNNN